MTEKSTKARCIIQRMGKAYGVNYDDKTYKNIKAFLESHKECTVGGTLFDYSVLGHHKLDEVIPNIYRCFIKEDIIDYDMVTTFVTQIISDDRCSKILLESLEELKEFSIIQKGKKEKLGLLYYQILHSLFFSEEFSSNTDIYTELDISSAMYSYRKEEAIMLFGINFFANCLPFWKNREDDIRLIQEEEGRFDLNTSNSAVS